MKKVLCVALFLLAMFPSAAFMAWDPSYEGQPDKLQAGHILGTFVWHNQNTFRLRTTTPGDEHTFTGTIHTNGHFKNPDDHLFKSNDYYHIKDSDTIEYQFTTNERAVGIDFEIVDGDYISFEIYMDGKKVNPMEIFVGYDCWHPDDYKFKLNRSPYSPREGVVIIHPEISGPWSWGPGPLRFRHW